MQSSDTPSSSPTPRIAIVRQKYRVDGGAERFVDNLLGVFEQHHFDVTLVARDWNQDGSFGAIRCNPPAPGRILRDWGFSVAVGRALRKQHFDLVQSHERLVCSSEFDIYRAGDGVHREWLKQRGRIQPWYAQWATHLHPYHWYTRYAEKKLFESSHLKAVICNSRMVRDEILNHFTISPDKLHVIYSGVDTQRFHPSVVQHRHSIRQRYSVPEDTPLFLMVGSGFVRKGVPITIEAISTIPNAQLMIVGKDKNMGRYHKLATQLAAGRVHFAGVQDDVRPFYGAADALILPALYDPLPNVLLEAMACGLPVVTSTKCGGAELIEQGRCGEVCDALDAHGLSTAINKLRDRNLSATMGRAARATIEPHSLVAMRQQLSNFYLRLLEIGDNNLTRKCA